LQFHPEAFFFGLVKKNHTTPEPEAVGLPGSLDDEILGTFRPALNLMSRLLKSKTPCIAALLWGDDRESPGNKSSAEY
jgi:hypothetical protein